MEDLISIEEIKPEDIRYEEIVVGGRRRRRRKIHLSVPYSEQLPPPPPRTKIVIDVERVENLTEDVDVQTDQPRCTSTHYAIISVLILLASLTCGVVIMAGVIVFNVIMLWRELS